MPVFIKVSQNKIKDSKSFGKWYGRVAKSYFPIIRRNKTFNPMIKINWTTVAKVLKWVRVP